MGKEVVCLDTSVLIDYFRNKNKSNSYLFRLFDAHRSFGITSITAFEIFRGSNPSQLSFWNELFQNFEIYDFDFEAAKLGSEIDQNLKKKGKQIAIPDLFIASIAIKHNIPLATLNKKDFEKIDQLRLVVVK
jgi:tRNA(fMet)-specific endonuclease VapC